MQFSPQKMKYDRAKTIFSPDGRIFQVEYAREAVNKGASSLGLAYKNGVVLAATVSTPTLQVRNPEKVFKIDEHIGTATSGLVADGRVLVQDARLEAQKNRMTYDEPVPTYSMAKFLADRKQMFTQYGGVRPFGTAMIVGGVNEKSQVFKTDPSGNLSEWKAVSIGRGSEEVNNIFEDEYKKDLKKKEAIQLAVKALNEGEEDIDLNNIEMGIVSKEKKFKRLSPEDLDEKGIGI